MSHYSPSQINMFLRCGEQYRRRYLEGERIPPGVAALRGRAVDHGATVNFRQKIESRADLPASEIVEAAAETFRTESQGELMLTEDEAGRGLKAVIGAALDETVRYAEAHARLQAPDYQPVMVQEKIQVASGIEGRGILGILDLVDDQDAVIDIKTKGRTPPQSDADSSIQLTTYHALFHARTGRKPRRIVLDALVGLKGGVKRVALETHRDDADLAALAVRIENMDQAIKAGNFAPASPDSWACSRNWCGYWRSCRYVNPNR